MIFRAAQLDDLKALSDLWEERRIIQAQTDPQLSIRANEKENWRARMESLISVGSAGHVIVGEKEESIVGFIAGDFIESSTGRVLDLALDAHTYHGGLGRELVAALRAWYVTQHTSTLVVCIPRFQAVEQAFWRSLGAREADVNLPCAAEYVWLQL